MDVVGSEIGQKMRSAIKAKLTELGCYVDDELPDYVMVMVANKRTRSQMEEDLQLFLGDNTELFVNWLHQVLKKLQEVTVATPLKSMETDKSKEKLNSKDHKIKEKKAKDKTKKSDIKKAKKKDKDKSKRKEEKKALKSKKKSKDRDMIRPNIPPLLMNIEKESEPSITDVFAGQILKNHGITLDTLKDDTKVVDKKPVIESKRPILPIIDPATILSQPEPDVVRVDETNPDIQLPPKKVSVSSVNREEQIKEMNTIEAKIQGLKQKLVEQLDSMSEDEDFLNIRTEADELMNDFAEDVFQEISQPPPASTPPGQPKSPALSVQPHPKPIDIPKKTQKDSVELLPQIELKLPKRPIRERLGARNEVKIDADLKEKQTPAEKRADSPERFTPDKDPVPQPHVKSAKTRLGDPPEPAKRHSVSDDTITDKSESSSKRLTSKVSVLERREGWEGRAACASVVRVRPRPRPRPRRAAPAPVSSLLLRAVADAHKSLFNIAPKVEPESQKVKRALVLPMRRCVDPQKIVIQVPADNLQNDDNQGDTISLGEVDSDDDKSSKALSDTEKEEYIPTPITKKINNTEYVPSRRLEGRTTSRKNDTLIIEAINIHNPTVDKDKNTQFIVTMDGYHPNAFLAKKLLNEGLLTEEDAIEKPKGTPEETPKESNETEKPTEIPEKTQEVKVTNVQNKRLSNTSDESQTQVIIKKDDLVEKRKSTEIKIDEESPPEKKRRASPIIFDVGRKKEVERVRERTESASSDNNHVTVTTTTNSHKYDSVPPLSQAERKLVWCRAFPLCRYGSACAFLHPRCKFAAACTRRNCVYSHAHAHAPAAPPGALPSVASHVVPVANYKCIAAGAFPSPSAAPSAAPAPTPAPTGTVCKYLSGCARAACPYLHPKPCRFGNSCANKLYCNFYHGDVNKWRL